MRIEAGGSDARVTSTGLMAFASSGAYFGESPVREAEPQTTNTVGRSVIYNATLDLTVANVYSAIDEVRQVAVELGGYLQDMSQTSIRIRVPASQFSSAIERIERIGEVVDRAIQGTDVTEELVDLDIRLHNLMKMRERLLMLLDAGGDIEDLLAIEKELQRITETIELIKGKIRRLTDSVAFSKIFVRLNSPLPQARIPEVIPFPWVKNLGTEVRLAQSSDFSADQRIRSWLDFELPETFVQIYGEKGYTRAMSGDGVFLLLKREANFEEATTEFWVQVIKRWLALGPAIAIMTESNIEYASGLNAVLLTGKQEVGVGTYTYMLAVGTTRKYVYTLEAWGPEEEVELHHGSLVDTIRSMDVRR
jgi:hypothetical protein